MFVRSKIVLSFLAVFVVACTTGSRREAAAGAGAPDAGEPYLGLSYPTDGFQIRSVGEDISPGDEREYCEVGVLPGAPADAYYVTSLELANGPSSHHLILTAATPGGPAEPVLRAVGIGNRVQCLGAQVQFGEAGFEQMGLSQTPYEKTEFPKGVGRKFYGGQLVVFDYHYLNTSAEVVHAKSAANFHLSDPSTIEHVAVQFNFTNFTIDTGAGESASFTGECAFDTDVMVGALTRHTHRWGTDFSVWFAGGARDGMPIWSSQDWEHDIDYDFPEPVALKSGEGFRFQCSYRNTTTRALRFGTSASDEMCILFGLFWEGQGNAAAARQGCNLTWVDSAGVAQAATAKGGPPRASMTDASLCISGSGPSVDDCGLCRCNSCGTSIIKCATDADCAPLLDCYSHCTGGNCQSACQSVIDQHSSAFGLLLQVSECIDAKCPECAPRDAGG